MLVFDSHMTYQSRSFLYRSSNPKRERVDFHGTEPGEIAEIILTIAMSIDVLRLSFHMEYEQ